MQIVIPLSDELLEDLHKAEECFGIDTSLYEIRCDGLHCTTDVADELMDKLMEDEYIPLRWRIWAIWREAEDREQTA